MNNNKTKVEQAQKEQQNKKHENQLLGQMYGTITNKYEVAVSKQGQEIYKLYLKVNTNGKDKENSKNNAKYFPFWYFVPKEFQNSPVNIQSVVDSVIHEYSSINFEQVPSNNGTVINVIKKLSIYKFNPETKKNEFKPVIDVYEYNKKQKELREKELTKAKLEQIKSNKSTEIEVGAEEQEVNENFIDMENIVEINNTNIQIEAEPELI